MGEIMKNLIKLDTLLKKIKPYISITVILLCTIIGGYGILTAPKSDQAQLERELMQNQKALELAESTPDAQADAMAVPMKKPTGTPALESAAYGKEKKELISVIGDSVFLGAAPSFKKLYKNTVIDAKISRQVYHGIEAAKKLEKKKRLGNTVIISLGTNGNFNSATGQKLIDYLGRKRTIYWIDAYGKKLDIQKDVNRTIRKLVKKNKNVRLIPWSEEGKKHPGWFYQDGTHLNPKGQKGFSQYILKNLAL